MTGEAVTRSSRHAMGPAPPWWSVTLATVLLLCAFGIRAPGRHALLEGSEVDYTLAARRGFADNYLDRGSRPLHEYVTAAMHVAGPGAPGDGGASNPDLWQRDVAAGDIAAYRHYHPPLLMYLLNGAERLLGRGESTLRLVPLLLSVATIATIYVGCILVLSDGGHRVGLMAAAFLTLLPIHVQTSTDVGWHNPYASLATMALFSIGLLLVRPSRRSLVAAAVTASFAFTLLEHAVFLYVTLIAAILMVTRASPGGPPAPLTRRAALTTVLAVSVLTLVVVWPASLLKLSVVKNLGVNAYYSRTLQLSPRAHDVYVTLFQRYPATSVLALATMAALATRRVRLPRGLAPFAVYAAAMIVLQLGNQNLKPLYYVSLQPALAVLSAWCVVDVLHRTTRRRRLFPALLALLTLAAGAAAWRTLSRPPSQSPLAQLVHAIGARDDLVGERVLVLPPDTHVAQALGFYLPDTRFARVVDEPTSRSRASDALRRGAFRFVVVEGSAGAVGEEFAVLAVYESLAQITDAAGRARYQVLRRPYD